MQSSQLCCATGKHDLLPRDTNVRRLVSSSQVQPHFDNMMEVNLNLIEQATVFGATDAPQVTAVVNKKRNPCKSLSLKLGAWNVRTTNDSDGSIRPERATAIICKELDKAAIDICALSEVRRPRTGNLVEKSHTIFWSGSDKKEADVGFAIRNDLLNQSDLNPIPINDRISTLRVMLKNDDYLTLISVYGPTMQRTQEEKEQFYEQLGDCLEDARNDRIVVLGDLNARVGKDWSSWPSVIGKHGVGNMNSNGLMLLEFCSRYQLCVMGTMFQMKNSLKTTWQHPRSKHFHQIDHVLANTHAKQYINVTKIDPEADCLTDHKLLTSNCNFRIQHKKKGLKPPKKFDITLTSEKKQRLKLFLDEKLPDCRHDWEEFKVTLQEAAKHTFERKKSIYAAVLLLLAYENVGHQFSIKIRFRYDGDLFDLRRLKAKTKTFIDFIREAQYADDIAIFSDSALGLQTLLTAYNSMAKRMGLSINIKKTETMCIGPEEQFFIDGMPIKSVNRFKYLGSIVTSDCSVNAELITRIQAVSSAYGRLRERVFDSHDLTLSTKLKVYVQCLTPLLTYGCETWTLYRYNINQLRTVQQRHLRKILRIKWSDCE